MSENSGICAIIPAGQNGFRPRVFGMGILVAEGELITCAHVIARALGLSLSQKPPEEGVVHICFPYADDSSSVEASLDTTRYFPPGQPAPGKLTDIAVLKLLK